MKLDKLGVYESIVNLATSEDRGEWLVAIEQPLSDSGKPLSDGQ